MSRQICVKDDVYEELLKRKDNQSFSSLIGELLGIEKKTLGFEQLIKDMDRFNARLTRLENFVNLKSGGSYGEIEPDGKKS